MPDSHPVERRAEEEAAEKQEKESFWDWLEAFREKIRKEKEKKGKDES
jgi:hypothetical protein